MPQVPQLGAKLAEAFNFSQHSVEMANMKSRFREIGQKHLDLSVTMGHQKTATLSRIEQELKAAFASEFNDAELGARRLELSVAYIKRHGGNQRTESKTRRQVKDKTKGGPSPANENTDNEYADDDDKYADDDDKSIAGFGLGEAVPADKTKEGQSPANENTDDEYADDDDKSITGFGSGEAMPARHPRQGASFFVPSAGFKFDNAPAVKVFLESFAPSLLHLYPVFVEAGITNQKALDSLASWPHFNLVEFFGGLEDSAGRQIEAPVAAQTKGQGEVEEKVQGKAGEKAQGQGKLKKVVVEALVLRLKASDYKD